MVHVLRADALVTSPPWRHSLRWLADAWRLFRLAPFTLLGLSLLPTVFEGAWQVIPVVGIVASKLLTPIASAWVLAMLDAKARRNEFAAGQSARLVMARFPSLLLSAVLIASVFAFQLMFAAAIGGAGQASALALGQIADLSLSRPQLAIVFASGVLPATLLMFVLPRVLLDRVGAIAAVAESAHRTLMYWRPATVLAAICATSVAALLWLPPIMLLLLPFGLCVGYASYRDVFDSGAD